MKKFVTFIWLVLLIVSCGEKTNLPKGYFFRDPLNQHEIQGKKLTPEILWKFGRVNESQISPDGKWVVYTVRRYSLIENKGNTEIFIVPIEGGTSNQLTQTLESELNPKWTIDGKKIGYFSPVDGVQQIWEMNLDGSDKKQISNFSDDIESFSYSPDGKKILFTSRVKTDSSAQDIYKNLPKSKAMVFTDLMYRHWDSWTDYKHSHIFIADYSDGKVSNAKDIMAGESFDAPLAPYYEASEISWSPDGKSIAYTCKKQAGKQYATQHKFRYLFIFG